MSAQVENVSLKVVCSQVVSADAMQTLDDQDQERFIREHFQAIRSIPRFSVTPIVTIIESNLSWIAASHIARMASEYSPILHFRGDQSRNKRVGVWMTNDIKEAMKRETYTLLDTDRIHFTHDFVSQSYTMRNDIATQLRNYKYELKPAKDAFSKPKIQMTGKGYGTSDDLAIVLQMLVLWPPAYYEHPNSVMKY
jgi:hypothetical protein